MKFLSLALLLTVIACNPTPKTSDIILPPNFGEIPAGEGPVLTFNQSLTGTNLAQPHFTITRPNGGGSYTAGSRFRLYSQHGCTGASQDLSIMTFASNLYLYLQLKEYGTYRISMQYQDMLGAFSKCSNNITYDYSLPKPPKELILLSEASPSLNPNPQIKVVHESTASNISTEFFLNSSCTGESFYSSKEIILTLPPLEQGIHKIYARTIRGEKELSMCSEVFLTYESLYSSKILFKQVKKTEPVSSFIEVDMDGDGRLDRISRNSNADINIAFLESDGRYTQSQIPIYNSFWAISGKDIIVGTTLGNIVLLKNNNDRTFTQSEILKGQTELFQLHTDDFNLNGLQDIFFSNIYGLHFMENLGGGNYSTPIQINWNNESEIFFAKIHNQAPKSLVVKENKELKVYDLSGNQFVSNFTSYTLPSNTRSLLLKDINGDGASDLIILDISSVSVILNDGTRFLPTPEITTLHKIVDPKKVYVLNLDSSLENEIVIQGQDGIYLSEISNGVIPNFVFYPAQNPGRPTFLDINKDGKLDLSISNWNLIQK